MEETRHIGESQLHLHRVFGTHEIEQLHHLRVDHIQCFIRYGRSFGHEVLEIRQQRVHMVRHLCRRQGLRHQRRIGDDGLDAGLVHQVIHQSVY